MKYSLFAGLTILAPGESLSTNNGSFTARDRETIDRLLEIGAKTHRHNGSAGLTNPVVAPGAEVLASGGTIGPDLAISVGITFEDDQGGETMISPATVVSTPAALAAPAFVPSGVADYSGGSLMVNTYFYAITYADGEGGETPIGPAVTVERQPGFASGQVNLSALSFGMEALGAVGWRLYRATGGGTYNLLATGDASEDTFTDDGTHSLDCDTHPPAGQTNTTHGINTLEVTLPSATQGSFINVYASITGDFNGGALLGRYPVASGGSTVSYPALDFLPVSPPPVNLAIGGAHKIDGDTELIDNPWKRPVATKSELPGGATHGDMRLVLDEDVLYLFNKDEEWVAFLKAGGGEEEEFGKVFTDEFTSMASAYMSLGHGGEYTDSFEIPSAGELVYLAEEYETPYSPKNRKYTGKVVSYIDFLTDEFVGSEFWKQIQLQMMVTDLWEYRQNGIENEEKPGAETAESLNAQIVYQAEEEKTILSLGFNVFKNPFEEDGGVEFDEIAVVPGHKCRLELIREVNKLICKVIDLDEGNAVIGELEVIPTLPLSEQWSEDPVYVGFTPGGEGSCPVITKFHVEADGVQGVKRFEEELFELIDAFPSIEDPNFAPNLDKNFELVEPGELLGLNGVETPGLEQKTFVLVGEDKNLTGDFDADIEFSTPTGAIAARISITAEKEKDDSAGVSMGSFPDLSLEMGPQFESATVDTSTAPGWHSGNRIKLRFRVVGANVVGTVYDMDEGEAVLGQVEFAKPTATLAKRYRLSFQLVEVSGVGVPTLYAFHAKAKSAHTALL